MRIVLLGAPGSGKGTQGHRLAKQYKVPEISTGDILREAVAAGTPLGRAAKASMDAGQLVPDDIVLGVIRQRIARPDARRGFILDGFPRNLAQAEQLDELLGQLGQPIDLALVVEVDVDVILQRLLGRRTCVSCGASYNVFSAPPRMDDSCDECGGRLKRRADDNEETIGNRLRIYESQTLPVIARYREQGRLRVVQGLGEIEDVFNAVRKAIEETRPRFGSTRSAAIRRAVARSQATQPEQEQAGSAGSSSGQAAAKAPEKPKRGGTTVARKAGADKKAAAPKKAAPGTGTATKKQVATGKKTAAKKSPAKPGKAAAGKTAAVAKKAASGKGAVTRKQVTAGKKTAAKKSSAKPGKTAAGKKAAATKKAASGKSAAPKKSTPAKKSATAKKGATAKKSAPAKKRATAKKQTTSRKKTAARKPVVKKKAAPRKKAPASGKKQAARKKTVKKKAVAGKKAAGRKR